MLRIVDTSLLLEISVLEFTLSNLIYQLIVTLAIISCDCAFPWVRTDYTTDLSTKCGIHKIDIYSYGFLFLGSLMCFATKLIEVPKFLFFS